MTPEFEGYWAITLLVMKDIEDISKPGPAPLTRILKILKMFGTITPGLTC